MLLKPNLGDSESGFGDRPTAGGNGEAQTLHRKRGRAGVTQMQAITLTSKGSGRTLKYASRAEVFAALKAGDLTDEQADKALDALENAKGKGTARAAEIRVYGAGEARNPEKPEFKLGAMGRVDLALPKGTHAWDVLSLEPEAWATVAEHIPAVLEAAKAAIAARK